MIIMFVKKKTEQEISDNMYLFEEISSPFIRTRILVNFKWYVSNAVFAKYWFYLLTGITIIAPVIAGCVLYLPLETNTGKLASAVILGISTVSAAFLTMLDLRKRWGLYRNQAEKIKQMLSQFKINANQTEEELLEAIENSMNSTHETWIKPFEVEK